MDGKKIFQRIFSFVLAWVIIFNYCDLEVFDWIGGATETEAGTLSVSKLWTEKKSELNKDENGKWFEEGADTPAETFWADTSQMSKVCEIDSNVEISTISQAIGAVGARIVSDGSAEKNVITKDNIGDVTGERDRTDTDAYDGETRDENYTTDGLYYTLEESESGLGWYRRYYVSTANQLNTILYYYGDSDRVTKLQTTGTKIDSKKLDTTDHGVNEVGVFNNKLTSKYTVAPKVAITLLCDIDLGGGKEWYGFRNSEVYLEINGGGHKIYNYYGKNYCFLGSSNGKCNSDQRIEIYDLTFKRCFIARSYGMFGLDVRYAYFNNVDWEDCVAVGSDNASIVLGASSGGYLYCYFKNCSISNSYAVGDNDSKGHSGLFASFNDDDGRKIAKSTYLNDKSTGFSSYYHTDVPPMEEFERAVKGSNSSLEGYTNKKLTSTFPSIYENCSTVGSNVYQLKTTDTYHSGVFVSCIRGGVIFKNCYANGSIFACSQIGGFIGGILGIVKGFNYPDPKTGDTVLLTAYFENCYSTGTVEGIQQLGGFIGIINNDQRANCEKRFEAFPSTNYKSSGGCAIFNNCYTTSSVGMEYSGKYLGGFVGLFRGRCNVYIDEDNTAKGLKTITVKHRFINCYAAGEVGGIDTDVSTDKNNTNRIGGFLGMYRPADFDGVGTGDIMTNCYYDKQTTGMRERDIGSMIYEDSKGNLTEADESTTIPVPTKKNFDVHILENELKYGKFVSLSHTLTGLNGVYTTKSDIQNVAGLTDSVDMDNANKEKGNQREDSSVWTYPDGYYPQLKVFANATKEEFGSEKKAELAKLNSQASTATVFLDHYDEIMNDKGDIVEDKGITDDNGKKTHAYDTVRDISKLFTFTSEANAENGNLGWELDSKKNDESKFSAYMGDKYNATEKGSLNLEYNCRSATENSKKVSISYDSPEVLMIGADDGRKSTKNQNGYLFQCYDFAPGKQFVKVTTCTESDYKNWRDKKKDYDNYQDNLNNYNVMRQSYAMIYGCSDDELDDHLKDEIKTLIVNSTYDTLKADYKKIVNEWMPAYKNDGSHKDDLIKAFGITETTAADGETTATVDSQIKSKYNELKKYPYIAPEKKDDPGDFSTVMQGYTASRMFRLIPTAYLEAGDVITVKVSESGGKISNTVALATRDGSSVDLPGFDHTVGVLYASTQSLPLWVDGNEVLSTRLGNDDIYEGQKLSERDINSYYDENRELSNGNLNDDNVFAVYSYFPSEGSTAENDKQYGVTDGFTGLINKVSVGNFYPNGHINDLTDELDKDNVGKTMVKVYRANTVPTGNNENDDDYTCSVLEEGEQITMTGDNLAKWSGRMDFDVTDKGSYIMTYYWRLTDGRYLERTRLVKINTGTYGIEMRTGVANDTTDSFNYHGSKKYTYIDCDVAENSIDDNEIANHEFPSDKFGSSGKEWDEYIKDAYDTDDYGEIIAYPDENGVRYWTKSKTLETSSGTTSVAWRRSADYRLVKLIVEVKNSITGVWGPMMTVDYKDNGQASIEEDTDNIKYQYNYQSFAVSQDSQTKQFSVIETNSSVRQFSVQTNQGVEDTSVKYINFNFIDTGQAGVELTDDIRVTALFKTVAADVDVKKYALIDNDDDVIEIANSNKQSLATADEYRSVDNAPCNNFTDKKAVLFGDKIIYRMKVQNNGLYNASNVIVSDTVPDGCTLVDGSVKMYEQKMKTKNLSSESDGYEDIQEIGKSSDVAIDDDMAKDNINERSCWKIDKDSDGKTNIKWIINPVNSQYEYYVQYEVTVDGDYKDVEKTIKNTADFTYSYINGDSLTTGDDFKNDGYNSGYPANAAYNTSTAETIEDEKIKYTVDFTVRDEKVKNYSVQYIKNDIPSGYELVEDSISVDGLGEVRIEQNEDGDGFKITPTTTKVLEIDDKVQVTFEIEKVGDDAPERMENISRLYFLKQGEESNSILQSAITKVDSATNEVVTDVRWLYLNLEKDVPVDEDESDYPFDSKQAFVFKLINDSASGAVYTDLYANNVIGEDGKTKVHSGNKLLQITKRGNYTVSEEDWAGTNYDLSKTTYSATDINFKSDDLKTDDITTADGANGNASMYLPRAMYADSTAIPLWAIEDESGNRVYPTVTCTNHRSDYAWLTAEKTVENSFTTDASQTTAILALARKAAENSSEDRTNSTPEAVVETTGLAVVEEEKE